MGHLRTYALNEFNNPNYEPEDESQLYMAAGTFILWLGWYFFNGGSTYTVYGGIVLDSAKVITNTTLSAAAGGGAVYFVKKPISLFFSRCSQKSGEYYKTFRCSQRYDGASVCNGCLAGLVAITAPCGCVEPWAAICIGIIAGILMCCFSRLMLELNVDDPLEAASVHYMNGIWGIIACGIFNAT